MFEMFLAIIFEKRFDPRETIVYLDTGVNLEQIDQRYLCQKGPINLSTKSARDFNGHGTSMFKLCQQYIDPKTTCLQPIKTIEESSKLSAMNYMYGLMYISNYRFEKLVLALEDTGYYDDEIKYFEKILSYADVYAAAGNKGVELTEHSCGVYPACLSSILRRDNFYVVSGDGFNFGEVVDRYETPRFESIRGSSISVMRGACD